MRLKLALALAALGGAALTAGTASAMQIGLATNADIATNIDQVRLVCNAYGRCWRVSGHAYGYYGGGPRVPYGYGGGYWRREHDHEREGGHAYDHEHGYGDRRW